jgi:aminoglycoside phosphotransferase (APT) family kinase protein
VRDELRRRIETRLGLDAPEVVEIDEGWDSVVFEVGGEWIVRVPRREEVRESMALEARLLAELAPVVPAPVPRFDVVEDADGVFFVAYRKLTGEPLRDPAPALAPQLAAFLAALHGFPPERARAIGMPPQADVIERCRREVLPLLERGERRRAEAMFDRFLSLGPTEPRLVHADLGPAHILQRRSELTGVIDWSDACLGDPALDFAWLLHGTGEAFATNLLEVYRSEREEDPRLNERALFYHRLGPWHEVLFGLKHGRAEFVETGLEGVRSRLP